MGRKKPGEINEKILLDSEQKKEKFKKLYISIGSITISIIIFNLLINDSITCNGSDGFGNGMCEAILGLFMFFIGIVLFFIGIIMFIKYIIYLIKSHKKL